MNHSVAQTQAVGKEAACCLLFAILRKKKGVASHNRKGANWKDCAWWRARKKFKCYLTTLAVIERINILITERVTEVCKTSETTSHIFWGFLEGKRSTAAPALQTRRNARRGRGGAAGSAHGTNVFSWSTITPSLPYSSSEVMEIAAGFVDETSLHRLLPIFCTHGQKHLMLHIH